MIACVLCGQPAAPFLSMLCESCDHQRQMSLASTLVFREIHEHLQKTLHAMTEFEQHYPDGAVLVEEAHRAVAAALPGIDTVYRQIRRKTDESERRTRAEQEKGRAGLTEESTFE